MAVPVPIASYTLSYNPDAAGVLSQEGGWPSFYSFLPDYMIGMNNYFYSFKNKDDICNILCSASLMRIVNKDSFYLYYKQTVI